MELTGGILATSNGTQVTNFAIGVTLAAGGDNVNLDATDTSNRTVISYIDASVTDNDLAYTATEVVGDNDSLLEQGELTQINIDIATQCPTCVVGENDTFVLEVKPPSGSYLVIQRTMPASMTQTIINLN